MTKAIEKDIGILKMIMDNRSPSETWCALTKITSETKDAACGQSKPISSHLKLDE